MPTIYGSSLSAPANRVRMCANLLELEVEFVRVNLREGEHKRPDYLAINPFGKVPALDDDGFSLFESNAIMKYLCRKAGSALYPDDIQSQARVDQWCDFVASLLGPAYGRVYFNRVLAPALGAPVSEESLNDGLRFIGNYLPVVDAEFADSRYIAGDDLSIADLALLSVLDPSELCEVDLSSYTNLSAWRDGLKDQDFYRKVHKRFGAGIFPEA